MGAASCNEVKTDFTIVPQYLPPKIIEDISYQHFKKIKLIGQGGFGKVYLIKSKETGKEYALKELVIERKKADWSREIDIFKKLLTIQI